jgi:hypothetical protein
MLASRSLSRAKRRRRSWPRASCHRRPEWP